MLTVASMALGAMLLMPMHHAQAQSDDDAEAQAEAADHQKKAEARRNAKAAAPPSALPGAESQEEEGGHANADLNPTAALFEAINRGSLNAAKEALNRGADMGARNVLGQKPIDLAIDLNRNDIIFLLLSLRTYNDAGATRLASEADAAPEGHASIHGRAVREVSSHATKRPTVGGGTPRPDVGFLGFGAP
ncbi:ankyrin repeat domain-containing protein [Ameyamaea chiangmaiensis]|uniref:Ankyrin repeat domain-containing protein n=1 Tax=Ameyamaea chiangmaiensis TaxID=442969 RepID=A0A850PCD5_9PROT|nr:ankyrin repeat domain-containing protein [Ameyamaea chiangmaiensis]NVN40319.1 ankyrin repeat domain-containing protein [Ameyamaea chiangmaiensis]